jgi:hypothetical protein
MRFAACLLVAFACSGALASEPGQPLDCSDWVIVAPGLTCRAYIPYPCHNNSGGHFTACFRTPSGTGDNEGNTIWFGQDYYPGPCGFLLRHSLYRSSDHGDELLAYVDERCVDPVTNNIDVLNINSLGFFPTQGRLQVAAVLYSTSPSPLPYEQGYTALAFEGFATLFDIFQSFTPQLAALGFHVPAHPEGLAGANSFDTFWGPLAKPLDFTQAHPLACDYPATPPHVGDYLTVPDTVPTPAPGQGVYYVTSATYQGATRYGRKTTAGHLTGRDPALLPACIP